LIEVVFLDAGETLLSPRPSFPELASRVISERGHDVSGADVIRAGRKVAGHFRLASDEGRRFSVSADESRAFWTALYTEMLEHLGIADEGAPLELYRTFSNPDNYGLFDDAIPALNALRERGLRLGVISNFESWLERLLEKLAVLGHFDVVAISGHLGWEKPEPDIFRWAVEKSGVPAGRCAHVGDSPYFDAEAAIACGLHGILLDRYDRYGDLDITYPRIASLAELPDLLEAGGSGGVSEWSAEILEPKVLGIGTVARNERQRPEMKA
jgi:putative hydrolase of the HAD superfamily